MSQRGARIVGIAVALFCGIAIESILRYAMDQGGSLAVGIFSAITAGAIFGIAVIIARRSQEPPSADADSRTDR